MSLFKRLAPRPGAPLPPNNQDLGLAVNQRLNQYRFFPPLRIFVANLYDLRGWWFVLVPWLAWEGWRTYRKSRIELHKQQAAPQAD